MDPVVRAPAGLALVPVVLVSVRVDPVVRAPAGLALVPVVLALVPVVPAVRPWEVRVPAALVVRAPEVPAADPEARVHVRVVPAAVATDRTVSVVHRARSRVRVVAATWKSCNRSS